MVLIGGMGLDRHTSGVARRLSPLLVGMMLLTVLAPAGARAASTDLTLGGTATVSGAEGGFALLRSEPGWDSMVLTSVPEGTVVEVLNGPFTADDASLWYGVIALDQQGVLPATLLIPGAGTTEDTAAPDDSAEAEGDVPTETEAAPPVPDWRNGDHRRHKRRRRPLPHRADLRSRGDHRPLRGRSGRADRPCF